MSLASDILYRISRPLLLRRQQQGTNDAAYADTEQAADYQHWRDRELHAQFCDHFPREALQGKTVLDFGCGAGYLCELAARSGAARVIGIDQSERDIQAARRRADAASGLTPIELRIAENDSVIPCNDAEIDVILCFDVLEHLLKYRAILAEWRRILRPGGRVLIWWQPYYHPWGHHLRARIPVPWAHVLFDNRTLAEAYLRIYEMPEYRPRFFERDAQGNKLPSSRPNPEHIGGINGVTMREFEREFRTAGFAIRRAEAHPFSGSAPVELASRLLSRLPLTRELFTAYVIYELEAPDA